MSTIGAGKTVAFIREGVIGQTNWGMLPQDLRDSKELWKYLEGDEFVTCPAKSFNIGKLPPELRVMIWNAALPTVVRRGLEHHDEIQAAVPGSTILEICRESRATAIETSKKNVLAFMKHQHDLPKSFGGGHGWKITMNVTFKRLPGRVETYTALVPNFFQCMPKLASPVRLDPHILMSFYFDVLDVTVFTNRPATTKDGQRNINSKRYGKGRFLRLDQQ